MDLADITKFAQALVSDECVLFDNRSTLDFMLSASDFYGDSDIPKNCHGLWKTEYAVSTMGHGGNTNGATANLVFDKESGFGTVIVANQQGETIFRNSVPKLIFGNFENNPIMTNSSITERNDICGNYVASRGCYSGAAKIMRALSYLSISRNENPDSYTAAYSVLTRTADRLYIIDGSGQFLYESETSDGVTLLEETGMVYIRDSYVGLEYTAMIILGVLEILTLVMLIIKVILKLAKKYKPIPAGRAILTGQLAKLVIGIMLVITLFEIIPPDVPAIICVTAAVSAVLCAFSALFAVKALITEKEITKFVRVRYAVSALCNLFVFGFVLYFRLYVFWA